MINRTAESQIKRHYLAVLAIMTTILAVHDLYYPSSYEGADGLRHYLVSRYSWKHPELFFYSWGKPFFTLITSPFSQFGLPGIKFFNLLCGIFTGWMLLNWRKEENSFPGIMRLLLLMSMPIYFFSLNSGYTEPLFGLMTIAAIRLALDGRSRLAGVVLSCLPYVRSEGYLFLPLFGLIFLIRREFVSIVLMMSFSVLLSVAGAPYFKSLFWIIRENPYDGTMAAIYGSGPWHHFLKSAPFMFGRVQAVLIPVGLFLMTIAWLKNERRQEIWLIAGTFVIYFGSHMIFWWKGLFNSLGLLRVMAAVAPSGALISWYAIEAFQLRLGLVLKRKLVQAIICLAIFIQPFIHEQFPLQLNPVEKTIDEAIAWYKKEFENNPPPKIYYLSPYMGHRLNIDVFDNRKVGEMWGLFPSIREWGWGVVPDSTIILWDNQLAANEGLAPLDSLIGSPYFRQLAIFKPLNEYIVLGGKSFEIRVFRKISPDSGRIVSSDTLDPVTDKLNQR